MKKPLDDFLILLNSCQDTHCPTDKQLKRYAEGKFSLLNEDDFNEIEDKHNQKQCLQCKKRLKALA